jgi:S1-C subfamily serine protease
MAIDPFKTQDRVKWGIGSGVIIDAEGHILTNSHVVLGLNQVSIALGKDEVVAAEVLGADPILDMAIVKMNGLPGNLAVARMGDSDSLHVGEDVIAIGNSMGLEKTVSQGIISGLNRTLPEGPMSWLVPYIQTDAALSPGNSGGPLINRCGEVIGINTAVIKEGENIGFAVPINVAKRILPEIIEHGRVIRPWHGINGKMLDFSLVMLINYPLQPGFLIETIEPGSAADQAGLRAGVLPLQIGAQEYILGGDIITKVNGESISSTGVLMRMANSLKVGDTVEVEYFREGEKNTIKVILPERPLLPGDRPK